MASWHPTARRTLARLATLAALAPAAAPAQDAAQSLGTVVVTGTRSAARAFDLPMSVDILDDHAIRDGQPMVNLSESLVRVPGVFAANRWNYAQDLQVSSRGFGARAQFGVRGVRLYQDNIPVTMPDGQGQTGSFSLLSAARIEVLRGPFSTLYGNASGGVIAVFTEDPSPTPFVEFNAGGGSFGQWTLGAKLSAAVPGAGAVAAASHFQTDGFRDHSSARRELGNLKLVFEPAPATRVTLIGNTQYQPETQDPLGLTRAQWGADPKQVDPSALQFNTRKTINQTQGGASVEQRVNDAVTVNVDGYYGQRWIRQYLALSGVGLTSSGGVTDLDRGYGGLGARATWRSTLLGGPFALVAGVDADRQHEHRKGFVNNNGDLGDLRRDEDDVVRSADAYAEAQWTPWPAWAFSLGVRTSQVRYTPDDHYITPQNPDDSGARRFSDTSPVAGVVWHATDTFNAYASYGQGFETPTFAEMAYRNGATGLNFDLAPATSRAGEIGLKALYARQRVNLAAFVVHTENEIVIDAATGGRTTFKNAGPTRRQGVEALWDGELPWDLHGHVAYTWLRATFEDAFVSSGAPVAAGARLPGVPSQEAYGELAWLPQQARGWSTAVELQFVDKLYVNERNSDAAPAYTVTNVRVGYETKQGAALWRAFARVNNLFDRNYAGSVIVGDTNGRFFEPAPGRNWFAGVTVDLAL